MRLHRLTLQAIGPYAGEHTIDFVELGRAGLFLLEGPTGAGKSTIIDAIVFGLYGELAGTGASKDRLHSHHAEPGVEPFVELVFETGSGVYRVRRTPAYQRPKQRGDGFTPQQASATLVRLTDPDATAGETMSTRAQEVGPEISRIVGLTREQFVQTIVLPQGEFAKFLSSDGEERSKLLRSLFGTEHYERLAAHLVEQRRQAHRDVADAQEALGRAIARFSGAAELGDAAADAPSQIDPAATDGPPTEPTTERVTGGSSDRAALTVPLEPGSETLLEDASQIVAALGRIATADAADADTRRTALELARREHAAATTLHGLLQRRAELIIERELLSVDDEPVAQLAKRLAAAVRADTVASALAGSNAAAEALEEAVRALELLSTHTSESVVGLDDPALAARREAITLERAGMAGILALEAADTGRETALALLVDEIADVETALGALAGAQERRESRRIELGDSPEVLERANLEVARAQRLVEQATELRTVLDRIERADGRLERTTTAVVAAKTAIEAETTLRLRRIDGMAGELAAELVDEEPCSVCGSLTHPAPAPLRSTTRMPTPWRRHPPPGSTQKPRCRPHREPATRPARSTDNSSSGSLRLATRNRERTRQTARIPRRRVPSPSATSTWPRRERRSLS
ncbi:MAG TPA: SMC family ATPase [Plantibacter sp.]|uniref:SMC family ATPase n=1 Tax=Plantibacter sp. TaxID=1871045 RepID=UPI002CDD46F0|nr:SMC family ATPase [Plantibacter sp.]